MNINYVADQQNTEQGDGPNHHACGTFGISPAEQARMPKASGDRSSRTLGQKISLPANTIFIMNPSTILFITTTSLLFLSPLLVIQICAFTYIGYKHRPQLQNIRTSLLTYYKKHPWAKVLAVLVLLIITHWNFTVSVLILLIAALLVASPFLSVVVAQKLIGFRKSQ